MNVKIRLTHRTSYDMMQHSPPRSFIKTSTHLILTRNILLTDSVSTTRQNNAGEIQSGGRITQCKATSACGFNCRTTMLVLIDSRK